ncbi:hypothetical protein [Halodurantibacterium flavum]|uniref:Uncharacterized protein n=1 Tax=Halodurantibacterium flavum TaxID=1382802 RepID=A0ABW4S9T8_9RHOB
MNDLVNHEFILFRQAESRKAGRPNRREDGTQCGASRHLSPTEIALAARHRIEVEDLCGDALVEWFGRLGNVTITQNAGVWYCRGYGQTGWARSPHSAILSWCGLIDGGVEA